MSNTTVAAQQQTYTLCFGVTNLLTVAALCSLHVHITWKWSVHVDVSTCLSFEAPHSIRFNWIFVHVFTLHIGIVHKSVHWISICFRFNIWDVKHEIRRYTLQIIRQNVRPSKYTYFDVFVNCIWIIIPLETKRKSFFFGNKNWMVNNFNIQSRSDQIQIPLMTIELKEHCP